LLIPLITVPLPHTHIQFGHCYKNQNNWDHYLSRFARGNGTLYDIEFLTDVSGRRVSAFGYHAGYAGTAIALLAWSNQVQNPGAPLPSLLSYQLEADLFKDVRSSISNALPHNADKHPRVLIIGALGRCGTGAINACLAAGIPDSHIMKWDMAETKNGGPFDEILASDIFVNCIYLSGKIPPFITFESLAKPGRNLRVICDVSCDPNNPNNPVPVYTECSTFIHPALPVPVDGDGPPLTQISIDHMPSLLPREASEMFSKNLLPSLLKLDRRHDEGVWVRAEELYKAKVAELSAEMRTPITK
jgi:saccharopine dehydrogenase (NAD+, L-lysine-forming)